MERIEEIAQKQGNSGSDDDVHKALHQTTRKATVYHIPAEHIVNGLDTDKHSIKIIDTPGISPSA